MLNYCVFNYITLIGKPSHIGHNSYLPKFIIFLLLILKFWFVNNQIFNHHFWLFVFFTFNLFLELVQPQSTFPQVMQLHPLQIERAYPVHQRPLQVSPKHRWPPVVGPWSRAHISQKLSASQFVEFGPMNQADILPPTARTTQSAEHVDRHLQPWDFLPLYPEWTFHLSHAVLDLKYTASLLFLILGHNLRLVLVEVVVGFLVIIIVEQVTHQICI